MKSAPEKIGIFGGTFSPPHIGHVKTAEDFAREIKADRLFIIPTNLPPHKDYGTEASADERLEMARLAFSSVPSAEVLDIEVRRGGRSYTYETLQELWREERELYFLCGTDMFLTLGEWRNPEIIFSLATVCYARREEDSSVDNLISERAAEYTARYGAKILPIKNSVVDISSTELRKILSEGGDAKGLLPDGVYRYILDRGLYL